MDCSTPGFPVLHYLLEFTQTPLSWWWHPIISSSVLPFSFCPKSSPASGAFSSELAVCFRYKVLECQLQQQSVAFIYNWLVWSPCCPRDSQESSPTPQFKSMNSSMLSLLHGPTLTSVHILRSMKYRIFLYLINGNRHEWVCKTRINCILFINWLGSCQTVIMVLFKPDRFIYSWQIVCPEISYTQPFTWCCSFSVSFIWDMYSYGLLTPCCLWIVLFQY